MCLVRAGAMLCLAFWLRIRVVMGCLGVGQAAERAVRDLRRLKVPALVTTTLTRRQYWKKIQISV